jgi:hypothetical protein|tara:strand:+ start:116 stop:529 length:414 start_codon:yes stop_codon:yes gene_type:complete
MSIYQILNSLEKSWKRDDILLKIKNGEDTDKIVNQFLANNEIQIKELNTLLRPKDIDLLNQVEKLSTCESKVVNKIKNLNCLENNENHYIMNQKNILPSNKVFFYRISSFMINWSNKVVVIALITISAIALSKQAWA